jgi:uncharacterized membrane protein
MSSSKIEVTINPLKIALILNVAFIAVYALNSSGIEILLLRQTIGLFYSLLVPGMLLMLTLKINESNITSFILYSVGLSLTSLTLLGLILNFAGPFVGIMRPLSIHPVNVFITVFSTIMCIFCFFRRKNFTIAFQLEKELVPFAIAFLIPIFLAVTGAYMVYYEGNNLLLLILLVIIALMAFSPLSKKLKPLYALIIFSASLSLIYHIVLSSPSFGGDNHHEYGFSNLVLREGVWNPSSMANTNNAVASINVLIPVLCQLCTINVLQAFKIVYPLVFSSIPVGLYSILKKQIKTEYAFFSAYFFLSVRPLYTYLSEFVKQGFAMFFLMLLIVIFVSKIGRNIATSLMLVLFALSLVISHYGVSYLLLIFTPIALAFQLLIKDHEINPSASFTLSYVVLTIAWYMYVSAGCTFESIIALGERVVSNIREMLNPETSSTLALLVKGNPSLSKVILKGLYLLTDAFIALGMLTFIYGKLKGEKSQSWNLSSKYVSFAIPSISFLGASLLPYITRYGMAIDRVYSITLLFLAPFCILGFLTLIRNMEKAFRRNIDAVKVLTVFFAVFLLFNTGFVTEIIGEEDVGSVALSQARIKSSGTSFERASLYCSYFAEEDIASAIWLSKYKAASLVASDYYAIKVLSSYGMFVGMGSPEKLLTPITVKDLNEDMYVYLRKINWKDGIMTKFIWEEDWIWNTSDIVPFLNNMDMIYSNGGSVIFMYRSPLPKR